MRRDSVIHILALVATFLLVIIAFGFAGRAIVDSMGNQVGRAGAVLESLGVQMEFTESGPSSTVYVYGKNLVASKSGSFTYHLQDIIGSNRIAIDDTGKMTSKTQAYPYGKTFLMERFEESDARYFFTGKERDGDLDYFSARYYNPRIGRFVSVDPLLDSFASYDYVNGHPLTGIDPTGMAEQVREGFYMLYEPEKAYWDSDTGMFMFPDAVISNPSAFDNALGQLGYFVASFTPMNILFAFEAGEDMSMAFAMSAIPGSKGVRAAGSTLERLVQNGDDVARMARTIEASVSPLHSSLPPYQFRRAASTTLRQSADAQEAFHSAQTLLRKWIDQGKTTLSLDDLVELNTILRPGTEQGKLGIRGIHNNYRVRAGEDYLYPNPDDVPTLLSYWEAIVDDVAQGGNGIVTGAAARNYFTRIHPFTDANGRTGNLIERFYVEAGVKN